MVVTISMEKFKADYRKAFYGEVHVVVQSDGKSGGIKLTATSEGLKAAVTAIKSKNKVTC